MVKPLVAALLLFIASHTANAESSPKPFKVCLISILSGQYSDVGQAIANAAQLAIEDYRQEHPDQKIDFVLEDDGADPKKGLSAYLRLKNLDQCQVILPVSTFTIGSVRDRINQQKDLTFILGNEPYEPEDDYIYMLSPAAIPAEKALGAHIATIHPAGKIQIVTSQNEALIRFGNAVKEGSGQRGAVLELPAGTTDFRTIAMSIKRDAPAALAILALPLDTANLLKELRRLKVSIPLYFDESIANSFTDIQTVLGDLTFLQSAQILTLQSDTDPTFLKRYTERFRTSGKIWVDYAYDAVQLALLLKDKPVDEARRWLAATPYIGVSGTIRFDDKGLRLPQYSIIPIVDHPNFKRSDR